jgi:hypothetical protein
MLVTDRREQARDLFIEGLTEAEVVRKTGISARDAVLMKIALSQQGLLPVRQPAPPPAPKVVDEFPPLPAAISLPVAIPEPAQEEPEIMEPARPTGVGQTSAGLREILFAELASLRAGKTSPKQALAVAKLADGICNTVKMEIVYAEHAASLGPGKQPAPLMLTGAAECSA